jgi:hypothetical protein
MIIIDPMCPQYAGNTLLASSLTVEQTGPWTITCRAGSFTTPHGLSYTLPTDRVFILSADATADKLYLAEFGLLNGIPDVLVRSQLPSEVLPAVPVGWEYVHWLINHFVVPAGSLSLDAIPIPIYAVVPSFPTEGQGETWGWTADGQLWQRGKA